jgi:hypothetical protein
MSLNLSNGILLLSACNSNKSFFSTGITGTNLIKSNYTKVISTTLPVNDLLAMYFSLSFFKKYYLQSGTVNDAYNEGVSYSNANEIVIE